MLSSILFLFTLFLGVTLSVSSSSWFGAWIGLELNLLSFIPLVSYKNDQYSSEAATKYFLVQALGSSVIITAAPMLLSFNHQANLILSMALLLKAGAAPFHFWFPNVMEGLKWFQVILLMTAQKIAPLSLLSYVDSFFSHPILVSSIIASALVGAMGGLNQTLLRKIMAYSSINHMAWMISAMLISETTWMLYFLLYCLVSSSVVIIFYSYQAFHILHIVNHCSFSPQVKALSFLSLLSLGGLPPFTGFIPKWLIIQEMALANQFFLLSLLLFSSLFTLFYYLRVSMPAFLFSSPSFKPSVYSLLPRNLSTSLIFINVLGLLFPSAFMIFL